MKLLIYGFESFGHNTTNISQEVVSGLADRQGMNKVILRVRFNDSAIINMVRKCKPNYILGLGQSPSAKKMRIEKLAQNEWASKTKPSRSIISGGPNSVAVTWDLKPNNNSIISYNAGRFFCNYSMYMLLTDPETKDIPFAFLHIPKNFDLDRATKFVEAQIKEVLV